MLSSRPFKVVCQAKKPLPQFPSSNWLSLRVCPTQVLVNSIDPDGQAATFTSGHEEHLTYTGTLTDSSYGNGNIQISGNISNGNGKPSVDVVHFNSNSLEELALQLRGISRPTVFDLGGRTLTASATSSSSSSNNNNTATTSSSGSSTRKGFQLRTDEPPGWDLVLSSDSVTIRGGSLELPRGTHLVVRGRRACLQDLTVRGSHSSSPFIRPLTGLLWIDTGAQDCVLTNVSVSGAPPGSDIVLGSPSAAECCAVLVSPGASARLSNCNLSGCKVGLSLAQGAAWKEDNDFLTVLGAEGEEAVREAVESAFLAASVNGHGEGDEDDVEASARETSSGEEGTSMERQEGEHAKAEADSSHEAVLTADILVSVDACKIHDNSWHGVLVHGTTENDCVWTHLEMEGCEVSRNGGIGICVMQHGSRLTAHHSMVRDNGRGALHTEMYAQAELVSCTLIGGNRSMGEERQPSSGLGSRPLTPPPSPSGSGSGTAGSPFVGPDFSSWRPLSPFEGGPDSLPGPGKGDPEEPFPLSLSFSGGPACHAEVFALVDMHGCMLDEKATVACSGEVISNHCVLSQFKEFSSLGRGPWGAWTWTWIQTLTDGGSEDDEEEEQGP